MRLKLLSRSSLAAYGSGAYGSGAYGSGAYGSGAYGSGKNDKGSRPGILEGMRTNKGGSALLKAALLFCLLLLAPFTEAKEAAPVAENPEIERRMVALSEDL